jgi:hypothetical protein
VLVNYLQACVEVLFYYHPAAWWISSRIRVEREYCVDELSVRVLESNHSGSRLSYAQALLALEEWRASRSTRDSRNLESPGSGSMLRRTASRPVDGDKAIGAGKQPVPSTGCRGPIGDAKRKRHRKSPP